MDRRVAPKPLAGRDTSMPTERQNREFLARLRDEVWASFRAKDIALSSLELDTLCQLMGQKVPAEVRVPCPPYEDEMFENLRRVLAAYKASRVYGGQVEAHLEPAKETSGMWGPDGNERS